MKQFVLPIIITLFFLCAYNLPAQISSFPYKENFDSVTVPALPVGWTTSTVRSVSGDFTTTSSTPRTSTNAILSTDATKQQRLISPQFNFTGKIVDSIEFFERRSSTHTSGVLLEASINNDTAFGVQISDSLKLVSSTAYIRRVFALPETLNNRSNVKFRWRIVGNGSGTSGTIRFDDIFVSVKRAIDLAVSSIAVLPLLPLKGTTLDISVVVKNKALSGNFSGTIQLFDSLTLVSSQNFNQFFAVNGTLAIMLHYANINAGRHLLTLKLNVSGDEDTTNNSLTTIVDVGFQSRSIVINEIMYEPTGDMPEWVECFNTSSDAISLNGWKISDAGTTKALLQNTFVSIAPKTYFVITTDPSALKSSFAISSPVFQASFSALNNSTPDAIVLFDDRGVVMDSVAYKPTWGGKNGNSLQRFDLFALSTDSSNWKSVQPTPGNENGIGRKENDLQISALNKAATGTGYTLFATIQNVGRNTAKMFTLKYFLDSNNDSIPQSNEIKFSQMVDSLLSGSTFIAEYNWNIEIKGRQSIIVQIEYANDQNLQNNILFTSIAKSFAVQSIIINEILYEPKVQQSEFVELMNRSSDTIDIADWKLMDQASASGIRTIISLSKTSLRIPPYSFVIVASDSSILSQFQTLAGEHVIINSSLGVSNTGEDIILVDLTNTTIDSVRYSPSWHLKTISPQGRSLERINPAISGNDARNWSSSVAPNAASPGKQNSIFTTAVSPSTSLSLSPNPFSPDNDGMEDFLSINYTLPANSSMIRVRIYDTAGRLIRRLATNEFVSSTGSLLWNGSDDSGSKMRIGMYIILFEALDNFGGVVRTMKDVAVVAAKL